MSSGGQVLGGIVGAVAGFFIPGVGVMLGASVGMAVGGYIDPPKGPKIEGPRLNDLKVQTAAYGAVIPRVYGTVAITGNIFWVENNALKETEATESQGGKGGGAAQITNYSYSVTFAVGLCEGPIDGVLRIWCGPRLIYDGAASDVAGVVASSEAAKGFSIYYGDADQLPDDRMQATLGVANTPAYRGLAYIVFKDFQLADYGNSLIGAQIKVEVVKNASPVGLTLISDFTTSNTGKGYGYVLAQSINDEALNQFSLGKALIGGYPETEFYDVENIGYFGLSSVYSVTSPFGDSGKVWENNSPVPGLLTSDGSAYYLDGVLVHSMTGAEFWGPTARSWRLPDGSMLYSANDYISGYKRFIRWLPGFPQIVIYVDEADIDQDGVVVVVDNLAYMITQSAKTYVIDLDTNTHIQTLDNFLGPSSISSLFWCAMTVGDDGRVYTNDSSVDGTVKRLNLNCTDFDETYHIGHGTTAIAVSNGIIYCVSQSDDYLTLRLRAYRIRSILSNTEILGNVVAAECLLSKTLEASDIDTTDLTQELWGYRVAPIAAIRSAIDPLRAAWPFDAISQGYKIKFKARGGSSIAVINEQDLDARAIGESYGVKISHAREMDLQVPRRVEVSYLDHDREYDAGPPGLAERLNTVAVSVQQVELPIVLTATEAAGKAETLLYLYWLERHDISFVIPPTFAALEPADVVTVMTGQATYSLRLTSINYLPDGRLECQAKFNSAAIYSPVAVGQSGLAPIKTISIAGGTTALLLDIPTTANSTDASGFICGANGFVNGWPGGALIRSIDSGQTWQSLQSFMPPGMVYGTVSNIIGIARTDIPDVQSVLRVNLAAGVLSSVSLIAMLNGANHFAYGIDGRWEIIAATNCVQNADKSWSVGGQILRGRFGSESFMNQHQANDKFVVLDSSILKFITVNQNLIGSEQLFRSVTSGQTIASAPDIKFIYSGTNLECLAPVYLNGNIDQVSEDWAISWVRRTRVGGEWRDYVDAALGETSEAYEVEIWNSSYTTLKRTITGVTTEWIPYTAAHQISDFGTKQSTLYLKIFQISSVVGRGYPLVQSISRGIYVEYDPNFAYLVLGMHMDGTNGSTTFSDIKGKSITSVGATISTAQSMFGGASATFNGSGNYLNVPLSVDFDFGTGNFTVSGWIRLNAIGGSRTILGGVAGYNKLAFSVSGSELDMSYPLAATKLITSGLGLVANTWYYVEFNRNSGTARIFVDGVQRASGSIGENISYTGTLNIGRIDNSGNYQYFNGFIDDIRVYKGVAVNTSNYSVPANPFLNQ